VDAAQKRILTAVIDRIIPADDFASASQAGVMVYLDRQFVGDAVAWAGPILDGLATLEQSARDRMGKAFANMTEAQQDALLTEIEHQPFFRELVVLTSEGFYADPGNGGNLDEVSWKMIGFQPRERGNLA